MTRTPPTRGSNLSDNLNCPHCNTPLPPQAVFCRSCGERVEQKQNGELESDNEFSSDGAQGHKAKTIRLTSPPDIYLKRWLAYQSRKNTNSSGRTQGSSPSLQDAEEVSTQPILSVQETESADVTALHESTMQSEPVLSSLTTS